ncbi:Mononegavirales RNA dependent RNA polymerase [Popillia japonica]|uniref:Mononegavirales RNA dependent RNA polymerase n=1 Tax=Popillia japonica TaxID=7064 RepID=A0AAW1HT59_POPJA
MDFNNNLFIALCRVSNRNQERNYRSRRQSSSKDFITFIRDKASRALGLEVTMEEIFYSTDVLIYGKDILYKGAYLSSATKKISRMLADINEIKGAYLSSATKKISRMLADINEIIPTVHDEISTLQSAGLATAQKRNAFVTPYILCQLETLFTLSRDAEFSLLSNERREVKTLKWFETLFTLSRDAEFSLLSNERREPFLNFFYRGHPDSLTSYLTTLHLGCEKCDMCQRLYIYLQTEALPLGEGDPELLILNPNSLNLESADFGSCPIQPFLNFFYRGHPDSLTSYLTTLHLGCEKCDMCKRLYIYLQTEALPLGEGDPELLILNPNSLNLEVYRVTEAGTRMSFIAKFCNSRTSQLILTEGKKYKQLRDKIFKLESSLFSYWMKTFNTIMSIDLTRPEWQAFYKVCPTQIADMLRHYTWLKTFKGSRMIGTTLPHPAHQSKSLMSEVPLPPTDNRQVECITYKLEEKSSETILETRGSFHPYIGSKTKEKLSGKLMVLPKAHRNKRKFSSLYWVQN